MMADVSLHVTKTLKDNSKVLRKTFELLGEMSHRYAVRPEMMYFGK